ncbi:helix-turn-helix transcriptional regulator [Microbacteriaceae bacterium VKM Ac-2854]|nr:helix-turn-helix transcriptional regulator [Microbacteriaceae bacterium VKM Ac-2854]
MLSESTVPAEPSAQPAVVAVQALSSPELDRERLGMRLRELRLASGMSLRALARELGISASAVSQIERGSMQPSVGRLIAIVGALGVPLAAVFEEEEAEPVVFDYAIARAGQVATVELDGGVLFRRLSPQKQSEFEFFESTYPPGATSTAHREFLRHDGFEVGTVTSGRLTIEFEDEIVTLAQGDSITFPCERPHLMYNADAAEVAVATWLIVHR